MIFINQFDVINFAASSALIVPDKSQYMNYSPIFLRNSVLCAYFYFHPTMYNMVRLYVQGLCISSVSTWPTALCFWIYLFISALLRLRFSLWVMYMCTWETAWCYLSTFHFCFSYSFWVLKAALLFGKVGCLTAFVACSC